MWSVIRPARLDFSPSNGLGNKEWKAYWGCFTVHRPAIPSRTAPCGMCMWACPGLVGAKTGDWPSQTKGGFKIWDSGAGLWRFGAPVFNAP